VPRETAPKDLGEFHYVGVVEFGGGLYPFRINGHLDIGYVQEKLRMKTTADVTNVVALLNALGHPKGAQYYLDHLPLYDDHIDHDKAQHMIGGGLYVKAQD
jgi:hypothetical protein